jgi:hypothetical protein
MQAALAPLMAAAGGAAPVAFGLQAATGVASGLAAYSGAKAQQNEAKINSFIGRTRAIQTDVTAREGMESELGTLRSTFSANNQRPTVGTAEVFNELRRVRGRDRRVDFGNRMQEASAYDRQASGAGGAATQGLLGGMLKAAPSIFDLYDWKQKNKKV